MGKITLPQTKQRPEGRPGFVRGPLRWTLLLSLAELWFPVVTQAEPIGSGGRLVLPSPGGHGSGELFGVQPRLCRVNVRERLR